MRARSVELKHAILLQPVIAVERKAGDRGELLTVLRPEDLLSTAADDIENMRILRLPSSIQRA